MKQRDEYGRLFVNGAPPNYRVVPSCETCRHVEVHYEGERTCSLFKVLWDGDAPEDAQSMATYQSAICDRHEPAPRRKL